MKYDLSIIVAAAKNEEFTALTVADILKNKRGNTEVIVGCDGAWPEPGILDHPDVTLVYYPESIGQRGIVRQCAKLSRAKYIAKTDSHCAFDEGFDIKMLEAFKVVGDNCTMVPVMRNLHVFSWKCTGCGMETYQGPVPEGCQHCDVNHFEKVIKWIPKTSPQSTAYRFNKELRFKYFPELRKRQKGELVETMSLQGSFFMMTREKYFELDVDSEEFGSWGQQGSLVALKTWLSGGTVLCNTNTWYAHLFRTQNGFSHPWGNPGKSQQLAIKKCQELFLENKWDKQVRPLSWLLDRFWDSLDEVRDMEHRWEKSDLDRLKKMTLSDQPTKGILFYTTNKLPIKFAKKVQKNLEGIGLPITSVSLKPMKLGRNIHIPLQAGKWSYFTQILAGLENMKEDIVFMAEHDVMYSKEHFDFTPDQKDMFYYDHNWWKVRDDGFAVHWDANQVSMLCAYRTHLIDFYRKKIDEIISKGFDRHYEPGGRDMSLYEVYNSPVPSLDYRLPGTLTGNKWSPKDFRDKSLCINWQEATLETIPGLKK